MVVIKLIAVVLFGGLFFMIARFTDEYFRPYKRKN